MLELCVGSMNPTKINAVKVAFSKYYSNFNLYNIRVNSKVPNQPIGLELTIKGARNRAKEALNYLREVKNKNKNIFGIGIEAGLVDIPQANTNFMDFQFCAIIDELEFITLGSGIGFEYPSKIIAQVLSNENTEIGEIMGNIIGNANLKNENGAISILSKNIINRTEILTQAVICALLPRINKELYSI